MANTIIPIEISTLLHTALSGVVPADTYVYARGVKTDGEGNADEGATEIKRKFPMVDIIPGERTPQQNKSVLMTYPVGIRVVTKASKDQWQVDLYTVAHAVAEYLTDSPTLGLTLAHFDALIADAAPDVGTIGENDIYQYMEWQIKIQARAATS